MKITRNKVTSLAVVVIILVMYNVVVFALPFSKGGGFWTGYVFSMSALLLTASVNFYAFNHKGLRSKYYSMPLASVAWYYLIIQLTVGLLEMAVQAIPYRYGIAVNILLLGACLIGLIAVNVAREEIERIDEKTKEKVFYIKSLQADVELLEAKTSDDILIKAIKALVETIRYSDPMSSQQLAIVENKIEIGIATLTESISDIETAKTLCDDLQQLFAERNRKCKLLK